MQKILLFALLCTGIVIASSQSNRFQNQMKAQQAQNSIVQFVNQTIEAQYQLAQEGYQFEKVAQSVVNFTRTNTSVTCDVLYTNNQSQIREFEVTINPNAQNSSYVAIQEVYYQQMVNSFGLFSTRKPQKAPRNITYYVPFPDRGHLSIYRRVISGSQKNLSLQQVLDGEHKSLEASLQYMGNQINYQSYDQFLTFLSGNNMTKNVQKEEDFYLNSKGLNVQEYSSFNSSKSELNDDQILEFNQFSIHNFINDRAQKNAQKNQFSAYFQNNMSKTNNKVQGDVQFDFKDINTKTQGQQQKVTTQQATDIDYSIQNRQKFGIQFSTEFSSNTQSLQQNYQSNYNNQTNQTYNNTNNRTNQTNSTSNNTNQPMYNYQYNYNNQTYNNTNNGTNQTNSTSNYTNQPMNNYQYNYNNQTYNNTNNRTNQTNSTSTFNNTNQPMTYQNQSSDKRNGPQIDLNAGYNQQNDYNQLSINDQVSVANYDYEAEISNVYNERQQQEDYVNYKQFYDQLNYQKNESVQIVSDHETSSHEQGGNNGQQSRNIYFYADKVGDLYFEDSSQSNGQNNYFNEYDNQGQNSTYSQNNSKQVSFDPTSKSLEVGFGNAYESAYNITGNLNQSDVSFNQQNKYFGLDKKGASYTNNYNSNEQYNSSNYTQGFISNDVVQYTVSGLNQYERQLLDNYYNQLVNVSQQNGSKFHHYGIDQKWASFSIYDLDSNIQRQLINEANEAINYKFLMNGKGFYLKNIGGLKIQTGVVGTNYQFDANYANDQLNEQKFTLVIFHNDQNGSGQVVSVIKSQEFQNKNSY